MSADVVSSWLTEGVERFFYAELANERDGGISPSTLSSAIDSLSQQPDPAFWGMTGEDVVALLVLRDHLESWTELRDILP